MLKMITDDADHHDLAAVFNGLVVEGSRRMLIASLETEVAGCVARHAGLVDETGRRLVVCKGRVAERSLVTSTGVLANRTLRVNTAGTVKGFRRTTG